MNTEISINAIQVVGIFLLLAMMLIVIFRIIDDYFGE